MTPYHVEVFENNGTLVRGFFYRNGDEFELTIEQADGSLSEGGKWRNIHAAAAIIPALIVRQPLANPLTRWRSRGYSLIVCRIRRSGEWCVVAGKGKVFEDTNLRFASELEARKAIDFSSLSYDQQHR